MEFLDHSRDTIPARVQVSRFLGSSGVREHHLLIRPTDAASLASQLDWIGQAYADALRALDLNANSALFRRFFCRDLTGSAPDLAAHPVARQLDPNEPCAVSWINQPPTPPAQIALWAYHVSDPGQTLEKSQDGLTLTWTRNGLSHCWTTGLAAPEAASAFDQTRETFGQYDAILAKRRLSLAQHVVRTWLFVKDIGTNYGGVVDARRECFDNHGLTADTHYIASTGIEGAGADPRAVITLDALAIAGVRPEQIRYLSAPGHMCPTYAYGVTFERGTAVHYRDRTHVFVSGTASIDQEGQIVHVGDVSRQLDRALTNIGALLRSAGGTLADMALFIAYVRDAADQERVGTLLRQRCGEAPIEVLSAAVCRPGWLVEIEGIAILPTSRLELPCF